MSAGADVRAEYEAAILEGLAVRVLRTSSREIAAAILRHLADAGLLPTEVESRVDPCDCQPCPECEAACLADGSVRQVRFVTGWRDMA